MQHNTTTREHNDVIMTSLGNFPKCKCALDTVRLREPLMSEAETLNNVDEITWSSKQSEPPGTNFFE